MNQVIASVQEHGVLAVFLALFLKRMGIPVPAVPFLLLAGARGAADGFFALAALAAATFASVLADGAWFLAGRRYGHAMLGLVCRASVSPCNCLRNSERVFEKRAALTVLLAKFVPGVAGLAPPVAGALGMRAASFTLLNLSDTVLWAGSGIALGLVFHRSVVQLIRGLEQMGRASIPLIALAAVLYVGWVGARRLMTRLQARKAPAIARSELPGMMAGDFAQR